MLANSKSFSLETDAPDGLPRAASSLFQHLPFSDLDSNSATGRRMAPAAPYALIEHDSRTREVAEKFIKRRFAECFDARVDAFMPRLFTVQHTDGTVHAAFGLRSARSRLFIEHYLERPIESAIAAHAGSAIERHSIVEVGHFAGAFPGAMRALIVLLVARLHREGFEWVVFTGTTQLSNAFHRLGLFPIDIEAARVESIPVEARHAWGRYYEHAPRVLAGRIRDGFDAFARDEDARTDAGGSRT